MTIRISQLQTDLVYLGSGGINYLFPLVPYRLFSAQKNKKKSENVLIRVLICGQKRLVWVA